MTLDQLLSLEAVLKKAVERLKGDENLESVLNSIIDVMERRPNA